MILNDRYEIGDLVAVQWSERMAALFPHADHTGCYQSMRMVPELGWRPFSPALCHDWHCPRCGAPTNSHGHHQEQNSE